MKTHTSSPFASGHQFLECLRWHDDRLWASDFFSKEVLTFADDGTATTVARIDGAPAGLGFLPDGSVLVVSQADTTIQRVAPDGSITAYADFSHVAGGPGNDMLVSTTGHAYVGNFGFVIGSEEPKPTALAHIDSYGNVERVDGDVVFPNGMALISDNTLLVAETFRHRITAYDVTPSGSLACPRTWAQLDENYNPDGIALDSDGGVWFGNALTAGDDSGFYRVVEGGKLTDKVPVPDSQAVACTFGGDDLRTLYMACNKSSLEEFLQGRSTAGIAVADVGRRGAVGASGA